MGKTGLRLKNEEKILRIVKPVVGGRISEVKCRGLHGM